MLPAPIEHKPHMSHFHIEKTLPPSSNSVSHTNQLQVDHQAERKRLVSDLRGQTIRIPDLAPLFKHWPSKTNPELARLRLDIRDWLNSTTPPGKTLDALQVSDFGLFGATWWPHATFPRLRILTYLAVWLFTWDDEIDHSDGTMCDEFGAAQLFRDHTLAYVRHSLAIDSTSLSFTITNRIILNFAPIGAALTETYTLDQRKRVYDAMQFYISMSEQEQRLRLSGAIPSLEEFWRYRLGSSALDVLLALNEFSWEDMDLGREFHDDEDVRRIRRYTNTIVSAVNDLLSLRKEVQRGGVDSLVPILVYRGGDVHKAVEEVVEFIGAEIEGMDRAAAALLRRYGMADRDVQRQVKNYVDGCKHYATGNVSWSLSTDRYRVEQVDGDVVMTL